MLFLKFSSQDERRAYGGSAFIELQFCKLPPATPIKKIIAVNSIEDWKNDSLYVNDENSFYETYSHIFVDGIYHNLQTGVVDIYGINYYNPSLTESIIERVISEKPADYEALVAWIEEAKLHNGFYILGI